MTKLLQEFKNQVYSLGFNLSWTEENDVIQLTVTPSLSVGIGESTAVVVKYNSANDKLSINPIGFGNTAVTVNTDNFELMNHGFLSGDKVFYNSSSAIGGLPVGSYFVNRVDDNNFKLCLTRSDSLASPPIAINLTSQVQVTKYPKLTLKSCC